MYKLCGPWCPIVGREMVTGIDNGSLNNGSCFFYFEMVRQSFSP